MQIARFDAELGNEVAPFASVLLQIGEIHIPHGLGVQVAVDSTDLKRNARIRRPLENQLSPGQNAVSQQRRSLIEDDQIDVASSEDVHQVRHQLQSIPQHVAPHRFVRNEDGYTSVECGILACLMLIFAEKLVS